MKPIRLFILIALLTLAAVQLACGAAAPAAAPQPTAQGQGTAEPVNTPAAAILEERMLTLEYPPFIRAGDSDVVRMTLELASNGKLTPTVSIQGNVVQGQAIQIPDLFETHTVLAEARLDMAGMDIRPQGDVSESLLPGQTITFYWSVLPAEVGKYRGTAWFYLRFIPKDGGPESRRAISAQEIEIEATSFLGLKAGLTRWLGLGGAMLGSALGFPFIEDVSKWLWGRLRGRSGRKKAGS